MRMTETLVRQVTIVAGTVFLCLMLVQVVFDVFLRAFAGAGVPATPEIVARYYMVAVSLLPLAYTEVKRRHIEATIFTDRLSGRPKQGIFLLGFVLSLAAYGLLFYGTLLEAMSQTARRAYVVTGVVEFPTWPTYWILPISFLLMALVLVMRVFAVVTDRFDEGGHDPLAELESNPEEKP
jgi:TRAP-type C4-dicarboxylate transport system permease small subunit